MKILYAGTLSPGSSVITRRWALERAGHEITAVDSDGYFLSNPLLHKISFRLMAGPGVDRLNRDLLRLASEVKPDVFWADKVLMLRPSTLKKMRKMGIATVSYMIDNPFGPRKDPGWRLYMQTIAEFDLHCTQRDVSFPHYKARGARDIVKIQTAYDRGLHFPPPAGWSDKDRNREASFLGNPYDNRAEFLTALSDAGLPIVISGSKAWKRALSEDAYARMFREGELSDDRYRDGIWRSKINISFLTKSNEDEFTQKSFEIAGCAGFLLAERSVGHSERFVEDEEAVFFSSLEECAEKIRRYLPDEAARQRIAEAGYARAERDGYHNDRQVKIIVDRMETIVPHVKAAAAKN